MKQLQYMLLGVIVIGAGALFFAHTYPETASSGNPIAVTPSALPTSAEPAAAKASPASTPASTKSTAQWIADTTSGDATTRAAAIMALAEAPRGDALPVLSQILESGEPNVDRSLALISLRDLALNQGDADGAVRDAIRHVIYHGDDFTSVDDAQDALDVIEESLMPQ